MPTTFRRFRINFHSFSVENCQTKPLMKCFMMVKANNYIELKNKYINKRIHLLKQAFVAESNHIFCHKSHFILCKYLSTRRFNTCICDSEGGLAIYIFLSLKSTKK